MTRMIPAQSPGNPYFWEISAARAARIDEGREIPTDATEARLRFATSESGTHNTPTGRVSGPVKIGGQRVGRIDANGETDSVYFDATRFEQGKYDVTVGGAYAGTVDIGPPNQHRSRYLPDGYTEPEEDNSVDPSNYQGIVNADNETGIALAPSAVRRGITADEDGTTVTLSDGTEVTAYPREESDETIRDTETGDPVDTPVGPGGVESDGDGMIGTAVAVVLLLVAGAAALLGGGD